MPNAVLKNPKAEEYGRQGYLVERRLFSPEQAGALGQAFMDLHAKGGVEGHYAPPRTDRDHDDKFHHVFKQGDPLLQYPRVHRSHIFMPESRACALSPRIYDALAEILGEEVLLVSSMFYFKAPGARGQAMHQDNFYLKVKPGTCVAVWVACEDCDAENGALQVVPGSHTLDIACPEVADPAHYFAKELVRPPDGMSAVMPKMAAGDALIFHGNLIHGSEPNRSSSRFRRSLVCHYMPVSSVELGKHDEDGPLLDRHGREHSRAEVEGGGPCGTPHESVIH